ncbi:hypothetical protein [Listeria booriae]|uniref:hypothetical protein n=1 Tax=Listeria booriae TaxID=1552123 RepID=UPI001C8904FE|nr:hypothetical protein [Listeria booriae]
MILVCTTEPGVAVPVTYLSPADTGLTVGATSPGFSLGVGGVIDGVSYGDKVTTVGNENVLKSNV